MPDRRSALRLAAIAVTAITVTALAGCADSTSDPEARRGRQVYLSQCTACHASDPAQPGPVGPPIKSSSRELLQAKVLGGTYPAGYRPKRSTAAMPRLPQVAGDIGALAEYLR